MMDMLCFCQAAKPIVSLSEYNLELIDLLNVQRNSLQGCGQVPVLVLKYNFIST